jgi:peptide-methionine (S)-S-oxide reductase
MSPDRRLVLLAAAAGAALLVVPAIAAQGHSATAVFAGGCFWTMERDFEHVPGVYKVVSGFAGGHVPHPTYEQVNTETTGHMESVKVFYDPSKISYRQLVDTYWRFIDPTDDRGQACDRGSSYRSAIFVATPQERADAEASKAAVDQGRLKGRIVVRILPAAPFWPAEDYHQGYARKHPIEYNAYRVGCGRDEKLKQIWGSAPAWGPHVE